MHWCVARPTTWIVTSSASSRHPGRTPRQRPGWLDEQVRETGLTEHDPFPRGLDQDHDAAVAGLTVAYSNGPIEGVNTKTIMWNLKSQVSAGQLWLTATIGSWVAVSDASPWRGVGPVGVGTVASRCSSRSRAA